MMPLRILKSYTSFFIPEHVLYLPFFSLINAHLWNFICYSLRVCLDTAQLSWPYIVFPQPPILYRQPTGTHWSQQGPCWHVDSYQAGQVKSHHPLLSSPPHLSNFCARAIFCLLLGPAQILSFFS